MTKIAVMRFVSGAYLLVGAVFLLFLYKVSGYLPHWPHRETMLKLPQLADAVTVKLSLRKAFN